MSSSRVSPSPQQVAVIEQSQKLTMKVKSQEVAMQLPRIDTATTGVETEVLKESAMRVPVLNMVEIAALVARTLAGAHAVVRHTKKMAVQVIIDAPKDVEAVEGVVIRVRKKPL